MSERPRFAIVNTCDNPSKRNTVEWVEGLGYCYMSRAEDPLLKRYDGMQPRRPTSIEEFGFSVRVERDKAVFTRTGESRATYEDGKPRKWQDIRSEGGFEQPLVNIRDKRPGKSIKHVWTKPV